MRWFKNYKFTQKKHPFGGVLSAIWGAMSCFFLLLTMILSYEEETPLHYGWTALFGLVFTAAGLVLGVSSLFKREIYRLFPITGILLCGVSLAFCTILLLAGAGKL